MTKMGFYMCVYIFGSISNYVLDNYLIYGTII